MHTVTLRDKLSELPAALRGYVVMLLLLAAAGGTSATFFLISLGGTAAAVLGILIVEPLAMAALLALVTLVSPDSLAAALLPAALRRASYVTLVIGIAFAGWIVGVFIWIAIAW